MTLMPVADALERVLAGAMTLEHEDVGLRFALHRTTASPVRAMLTQPPFHASAMDGYAVRSADTSAKDVTLKLVGVSAAGHPFEGVVGPGEAVRIFTGAAVPDGSDAIIIQEDAESDGKSVTMRVAARPGGHIRPLGQDFKDGDSLINRGHRLTPRDILLAAAAGHPTLEVVRKPIVAILATGDELVEPGDEIGPGQIVGSNSYGLAALVEAAGGAPQIIGIADDSLEDLADALRATAGADILVTIGGASVGDHDLVRPALEKAGAHLEFYKVAMRPGKPVFFGSRVSGGKLQRCIGLPGNPVSSLITARVFLVPLIGALLGRTVSAESFRAVLGAPIEANGPRDHYMRAQLDRSVSPPLAVPLPSQDSALMSSLARADCLIVVPASTPAQPEGAAVSAIAFDF